MEEHTDTAKSKQEHYYQKIIKKTQTGITFPKELRDELFQTEDDIFFKLIVPKERDQIILKILSPEEVERINSQVSSTPKSLEKKKKKHKKDTPEPKWGEYFIYDFKNQDKIKSILESAYYKFAENPEELDDAMGRVKYALVSFLSSIKTENSKLYFSVIKFLGDVINSFNYPQIIEWMYEKVIPNIESKFLYELSLLELVELSVNFKNFEQAELYVKDILNHLEKYSEGEKYNIMNTFTQLIKTVREFEERGNIPEIIKEKLIEFEAKFVNIDNKIQLIEFLEDLRFIEDAYHLIEDLLKELPSEDHRIKEVRKIKERLKEKPL